MKKNKIKLIILAILGLGFLYFNVVYINPNILTVRQETLKTAKMPANKNLTLVYFSDIQYDKDKQNAAFNDLAETINAFDADVVIFGGDLFDFDADNGIDNISQETIIQELSAIECSLGKYAVLGDQDHINQETIKNILTTSKFEVLSNTATTIYDGPTPLINIVAIEPQNYMTMDVNELFNNLDENIFTLDICHTPDTFGEVNRGDYMLSGHTLNGQLYIPFFSQFFDLEGGNEYYRHKYHKENLTLDITSGIGTKNQNIRFLADPEIVVYQIHQ